MHQAPPARRQGSLAALTQLTAQTRAAAEGPRQGVRAALSWAEPVPLPGYSTQGCHGGRDKGQPGDRAGWLVMVGLAFLSSQPGKQREWEVFQGWGSQLCGSQERAGGSQAGPACIPLPSGFQRAGSCQPVLQQRCPPWVPPRQLPIKPIHHSQAYLRLSEPRPLWQRNAGWDVGADRRDRPTRAAQLGPSPQECPERWVQADT